MNQYPESMNMINPDRTADDYIRLARSRSRITALQTGDVVYIRMLKCASSFFHNNFESWGWTPIAFEAIDWDHHHVFAHMLDPVERRHKGAAEYIQGNHLQDIFLTNPDFRKFISEIPVFDDHTASYHEQLGNYCKMIDWIPISGRAPAETARLTELLLWSHGIRVLDRWNWEHARPADARLRALQLAVRECTEQAYHDSVYRYLLRDCMLHNRVCANFDPAQTHWENVSWLDR
jgi:hypothetical protein